MKPYDTITYYCPVCHQRNEHVLYHPHGKNEFYHATNIPSKIAVQIVPTSVNCKGCDRPMDLCLEDAPVRQYNLLARVDCSNQPAGMDSWYDWGGDTNP